MNFKANISRGKNLQNSEDKLKQDEVHRKF